MTSTAWPRRIGRRVAPEPGANDDIVEIRKNRSLRIRRLNPKTRDEKFEKEMQVYLQYRESGMLGIPVSGYPPITRQKTEIKEQNKKIELPDTKNQGESNGIIEIETNHEHNKNDNQLNVVDREVKNTGWATSVGPSEDVLDNPSNQYTAQLHSPSRYSNHSQGVQSASGVHVSVTRPSSEVVAMDRIRESKEKEDGKFFDKRIDSNSFKSPRKTKGHRPISAKSIKHGAMSIASSDVSDNLNQLADLPVGSSTELHLDSSYKNVTLFFIHGVGGSADVWNAQTIFFASLGFEVIVPDLIGHGFSNCPNTGKTYHFNEILADMEAIFDKYCKKQNIIIGHSYGCAFAAALGRRRARRVSKLVLVSGGAPIPLAPQPGVFSLPICMLSCIRPCLFNSFERNAFHNVKDSGMEKELAFDVPLYVLSHMMHGQDWMDGDELYHQWITAPTLLLHGKYDKFVSLEEEQEMEKAIYCSRLEVVDNASHMVMMEAPKQVNQILYDFIFQEANQMDTDRLPTVTSRTPRHHSGRSHKVSKSTM